MDREIITTGKLGSIAEDLFMELFCNVFGPEKSRFVFTQYPFVDIYGNNRFIDFALESDGIKIAIEIDGETYHNPKNVSDNKYYDDMLTSLEVNSGMHITYIKSTTFKILLFIANLLEPPIIVN